MADPVRYFDGKPPRAIAHRGLALACAENTLPAFAAALKAGADILETDVHASADGVCVIFHDDDLARVTAVAGPVESLRMDELRALELAGGGRLATLAEALAEFPSARFNIDVKTDAALDPALNAIAAADAASRVLITSFDQGRRRRAVRRLPGAATSASTPGVVLTLIGVWLRLGALVRLALRDVDAVQVPHRRGAIRVVSPAFVRAVQNAGREVHVWTVNDSQEMHELLGMGVDGIISDRCDTLVGVIRGLGENGRMKKIS
ncbi:glycerophosphodiester phosphodiesterase [Planctomonas sp. JC2975]|uniref:glycerophosphodiester phosphodiesterase family protein n=1 Tax=Planctomonas sp. JC2975 TaxID=2729626 RepID=UPI0014737D27|nr:glycerophosphodiester phosphodiesterase family protein [Planctomonas sp. JC2975]NNC10445.1 glycerophosphodiester phosphodiesterase [Planctomonas sp. JC2975]